MNFILGPNSTRTSIYCYSINLSCMSLGDKIILYDFYTVSTDVSCDDRYKKVARFDLYKTRT